MFLQGNLHFPLFTNKNLLRFNRILWTSVEANYKNILVGSFSNGKIEVYDVEMLLNAESYHLSMKINSNIFRNGIIEVPKLHSGSVNGLCSSFFQPNLIATGATNGEVIIF